jgi:hypothetical protein
MVLRSLFGRWADGPIPVPPRWWRYRFWILAAVSAVVAGSVVGGLEPWQKPPAPCGPGLTPVGSPQVCVGLDLDSTPLRPKDPLADLERATANLDAQVTSSQFVTIVVLNDLTSDPAGDSVAAQTVRHAIQGSLTGMWQANNETTADGRSPQVKLLLANFGSAGSGEKQAVDAIIANRDSRHIVAVTDFGQSLSSTRNAIDDLSHADIAEIGSVVTGDDMNQYPSGGYVQNFFRVVPTNSESAVAAVGYIAGRSYQNVMLIDDTNSKDDYATTLAASFRAAYATRYPRQSLSAMEFTSPDTQLNDMGRSDYMQDKFGRMHGEICTVHPDLIYFAGRGVDLQAFLVALSQGGSCALDKVDVMTGDDATAMLPMGLPNFSGQVQVFYTGYATAGEGGSEWDPTQPGQADNANNFRAFQDIFTGKATGSPGFGVPNDLADGYVILNHDAVLTAAAGARLTPKAARNPTLVASAIASIDCLQPIPGASGEIAFATDSHGNPVDKPMPIMQITAHGPQQRDLVWSDPGQPFKMTPACR